MTRKPLQLVPTLPPAGSKPLIVLSLAGTQVERDLVTAWVRNQGSTTQIVEAAGPHLRNRLADKDDPLVVPVSVVWLPKERHGNRGLHWSDLLLMTNPRRPRARGQRAIVAQGSDRWRVIMGEPARVSDLRARWTQESGSLTSFVVLQATLALQRAERAIIGDRYKVPRLVAEQIEASSSWANGVTELSKRTGQPRAEVAKEAADQLHQIATVRSQLAVDAFYAMMAPMHAKAWTVIADEASLNALREVNKKHALVFLPSHRSYADPLVLSSVLADNDFPRNHTLGGNNMSFWPLGALGRRAGVVFIPRSLKGNEANKLALREFLGYLVSKRFNLEWYLEGGRSRTGKLRAPRYGLLRYLVDAVEAGHAEDVQLVPVSIVYDQLPEISGMVAEDAGAKKTPETLPWLAKYVRGHQQLLGTVHVRFGAPLSLNEGLADSAEGQLPLHKVAFEVYDRINQVTPILSTSLVTLALLGMRERGLTVVEVQEVLTPLLNYVERRALPESGLAALRTEDGISAALAKLAEVGVVTSVHGVHSISQGKAQLAAYYRNGAVHWFVNRAIVELATLTMAEQPSDDPVATAWAEALRLRDLLKYEFFFSSKREFNEHVLAELELMDPGWRDKVHRTEDALALLAGSGVLTAHRVLRSFLEAYSVVADRLATREPEGTIDIPHFLDDCTATAQRFHGQGRLHSGESVSRALFETGLELAENRSLVARGGPELREHRQALSVQIADVLRRIALIDDLDHTLRKETAHVPV